MSSPLGNASEALYRYGMYVNQNRMSSFSGDVTLPIPLTKG